VSRWEGLLLFAGLVAYTVRSVREGRRHAAATAAAVESVEILPPVAGRSIVLNVVMTIAGLGLLVAGSRLFVDSAVEIARGFGVSELVIGLTLVAAGTSLPEVATSVMATIKGERDIAVGNVVGSNIFNILAVLGLSSVVAADGVRVPPQALRLDIPVMLAVAAMCLPVFYTGREIARWEGAMFLAYYIAYVSYLCLAASGSDETHTLAVVVFAAAVPLSLVLLVLGVVRHRRAAAVAAVDG
jgi:cation:H+ antiporter